MFRLFQWFFIALIIYFLSCDSDILQNAPDWYWGYAYFAEWREKPCDYSTNAVVTNYYNPGNAFYFRQEEMPGYFARIDRGDTVIVGLDYYARFRSVSPMVPPEILLDHGLSLAQGAVLRFKTWGSSKEGIYWNMIQEAL